MTNRYVIEEHHEAFLVWNWAKDSGIMESSNNTLSHVDDHSDLGMLHFKKLSKKLK